MTKYEGPAERFVLPTRAPVRAWGELLVGNEETILAALDTDVRGYYTVYETSSECIKKV